MFKKPFTVNQTHKVSGADRKKIRRAVEKALQPAEEALDFLLPPKAGDLELAKLPAPSRITIYLLDKVPVIVDVSGKGDFVPTVFGLWQAPQLLPQLTLKHPAVSQYIAGGADLMLPGVDIPPSGLPTFAKNSLVSISVPGNPAPIAVGYALMNSADVTLTSHGKGKIVEVIQAYGDCLWADLGNRATPNDGFLPGVVLPVGMDLSAGQTLPSDLDTEVAGLSLSPSEAAVMAGQAAAGGAGGQEATAGAASAAAPVTQAAVHPAASELEAGAESSSSSCQQPMEELLELALLQALHKGVKDSDLPVAGSVLWVQHMVPGRPPGSVLDVKKSQHKKMSKFLQHYAKEGLLQCKEDKHSGDVIISAVNRNHSLYQEFRPYKVQQQQQGSSADDAAAAAAGGARQAAAGATGQEELLIEEVYTSTRETKGIFEAVQAAPDGLYTASEAYEVVAAYAKQANLEAGAPDNRTLALDPYLCDALYKGTIKKGELYPSHIAKADLRGTFLKRLQPRVCMSRGQLRVVRKGGPPMVHINSERRQGNKHVTRIVGMEDFLVPADALAQACQKRFACATTTALLPGKQKSGHEVIIQGNVVEKVADYLISTYGVPKKYFLVKK